MNQYLKQRIVGVAVITALVAIFLPMLFYDTVNDNDKTISELPIPNIISSKSKLIKQKSATEINFWFIRVGSFKQKNNAIALKNKIVSQGFIATIKKVTKDEILHQVIVGPLDQAQAEATKIELDKLNNVQSILYSYP